MSEPREFFLRRLSTMRHPSQGMSGLSWLVLWLGFFPALFVLFHPTVEEFSVFFLVENLGLLLTGLWDKWYLNQSSLKILRHVWERDHDSLSRCSTEEKREIFGKLVRFPSSRAIFCVGLSAVKIVPGALIIVFYWRHDGSIVDSVLRVMLVSSLSTAYLFGGFFIEAHILVSNALREIHARHDWSDIFRMELIPQSRRDFESQERISKYAIWVTMFLMQWFAITNYDSENLSKLAIVVSVTGASAAILFSRLHSLHRRFFMGALQNIFEVLNQFDPEHLSVSLPLHSSPVLAHFERTFNSLIDRIRQYEQELSHWIFQRTEENRALALGEVSSLIVHDLSSPLHVIGFCIDSLREDPNRISDPRYFQQLESAARRATDLVGSLRAYIKSPKETMQHADFGDVFEVAKRLVELSVGTRGYSSVDLKCHQDVEALRLTLSKADLTHVLVNLLGNSFENLLNHKVSDPFVLISLVEKGAQKVSISFDDNGSGLSTERFENLTSLGFIGMHTERGMGLRLVRRLVERHHGALECKSSELGKGGTRLVLTLPYKGNDEFDEKQTKSGLDT